MTDLAIKVEGVGKEYRLHHLRPHDSLKELVTDHVRKFFRGKNGTGSVRANSSGTESFWALRDVSFKVHKGEVLGIIGRNGAGKSTLLKILSRITHVSEGAVSVYGRIGTLLEVGTGFHPELSGRENIYLNGAILGMKRAEIRKRFDEIVAFSEMEKFLDTPVKHYSSGMYMRLAFAVAAHLEPEILIVDEVLAVGDAQFQKKCLGKMKNVATEGRTVLFVSHNMAAVTTLCTRAIQLSQGKVVFDGLPAEVIEKFVSVNSDARGESVWPDVRTAPGTETLRLHAVRIVSGGRTTSDVEIRNEIAVNIQYWNLVAETELAVSLHVTHHSGVCVFSTGTFSRVHQQGLFEATCLIPGNFLNDGMYSIRVYLITDVKNFHVQADNVVSFVVHDTNERPSDLATIIGVVRPSMPWYFRNLGTLRTEGGRPSSVEMESI